MTQTSKTSSSRRKGDEYQDLTALQLALDSYIANEPFELFIEYDQAGSLDDILRVFPQVLDAYQVKHAVNDGSVYVPEDFTKTDSVVFMKKFADSWKALKTKFPHHQLRLHLRSNRSLDATLAEVVTRDGYFDDKFRANRYYKEKRILRKSILDASGLTESEFQQFLLVFHFDLKMPPYLRLEELIKAELLDHKLGISDTNVFAKLKRLIEHHAIETRDPVTPAILNELIRDPQTRHLVPQSFTVDAALFVEQATFVSELDALLAKSSGQYAVVTGLPGSGKSTAMTAYCDTIDEDSTSPYIVVRYYCFVSLQDNFQHRRLQAQSLRTNILTELQRRFPNVLSSRRFDFSHEQFIAALELLSAHCQQIQKKLVILLDGLDHVERDDSLRDSVIAALPASIPTGIVFLISSQELHRWQPLALLNGRDSAHVAMPLFSREQTRIYVVERCGIDLSDELLNEICQKSAGLPLYLRYLVKQVVPGEDPAAAIATVPAAVDGDIRNYYQTLWTAFDADGREDARYLSSVLAGLHFSVHEGELRSFQTGVPDTPRFDAAVKRLGHLLKNNNKQISIFHDSFRVFVKEHTPSATQREIEEAILARLKQEEHESTRWFAHANTYALSVNDFEYLLRVVNRDFVGKSLGNFREASEIFDWIDSAIQAASQNQSLSDLSRLGSLKYRTHERLEFALNPAVIIEILLNQGRVDNVIDQLFDKDLQRLRARRGDPLQIIPKLVDKGLADLGSEIFYAYLDELKDPDGLQKQDVIDLARCLGLFKKRVGKVLRWISEISFQPDILEPVDFAIAYSPHLAAYLDSLVSSRQDNVWTILKRLKKPFPNQLIRQLIIRSVGNRRSKLELRTEVDEYLQLHSDQPNIEMAYFAAKAGLSQEHVHALAGYFEVPPRRATDEILITELRRHLRLLACWAVVFGYEQNSDVAYSLKTSLLNQQSVWSCTQLHLLRTGEVLGNYYAEREVDWFEDASEALNALEAIAHSPGERTPDALETARSVLKSSISWLSEVVAEKCPENIEEWIEYLRRVRHSFIWTQHFGIGEAESNYSFELAIWRRVAQIETFRSRLRPLLLDCAETYKNAQTLKGSSRSDHFLSLSSIAAICGLKSDSRSWLEHGIRSTLAYGYRKDGTLQVLTDILIILGKYRPEKVLPNSAHILEMIKWMPEATDGKQTKHFAQHLFPIIAENNRPAALELLRTFFRVFARWQALECVELYVKSRRDGNPECLWALCSLVSPNDSFAVRSHVASLASTMNPRSAEEWKRRLDAYAKTMINPRHWPAEMWNESSHLHRRPPRRTRDDNSNSDRLSNNGYTLNGQQISHSQALELCRTSFATFTETLTKLKAENSYVSEYDLFSALDQHIDGCQQQQSLEDIEAFLSSSASSYSNSYHKHVGRRYLALGNIPKGLDCLEKALHEDLTANTIAEIAKYDSNRALQLLVKEATEKLLGPSYHGFDMPRFVAGSLASLGKVAEVEVVFDGFLAHCQELFAQLPPRRDFEELRTWHDDSRDECEQIVNLLLDRLNTHDLEYGNRVTDALSELASSQCNKVLPILLDRIPNLDELAFWRFLQMVSRLAETNPADIRQNSDRLASLLDRPNALVKLSISKAIRNAFRDGEEVSDNVEQKLGFIQRQYSSIISYKTFVILSTNPSEEFLALLKHPTRYSFKTQLISVCEVLELDPDALTAQIERMVQSTGPSFDEIAEETRSLSRSFAHPQGWPVTWFISDFDVQLRNCLYQFVDEALTKRKYQPEHVEAIWRIIQKSDPEFSSSRIVPMPNYLAPLIVAQKNEWMVSDSNQPSLQVNESLEGEWITAFELRHLAQDSPWHGEFVAKYRLVSALILPESIQDLPSLDPRLWGEEFARQLAHEDKTWQQFRGDLIDNSSTLPVDESCVPFVAYAQKTREFLGFRCIASLSTTMIGENHLTLSGTDVFMNGERIAFCEFWQEGHSDEDWNDAPLSYGTRLRVKSSFISEQCSRFRRAFAIRTIENRIILKDFKPEPEEKSTVWSFQVWPHKAE